MPKRAASKRAADSNKSPKRIKSGSELGGRQVPKSAVAVHQEAAAVAVHQEAAVAAATETPAATAPIVLEKEIACTATRRQTRTSTKGKREKPECPQPPSPPLSQIDPTQTMQSHNNDTRTQTASPASIHNPRGERSTERPYSLRKGGVIVLGVVTMLLLGVAFLRGVVEGSSPSFGTVASRDTSILMHAFCSTVPQHCSTGSAGQTKDALNLDRELEADSPTAHLLSVDLDGDGKHDLHARDSDNDGRPDEWVGYHSVEYASIAGPAVIALTALVLGLRLARFKWDRIDVLDLLMIVAVMVLGSDWVYTRIWCNTTQLCLIESYFPNIYGLILWSVFPYSLLLLRMFLDTMPSKSDLKGTDKVLLIRAVNLVPILGLSLPAGHVLDMLSFLFSGHGGLVTLCVSALCFVHAFKMLRKYWRKFYTLKFARALVIALVGNTIVNQVVAGVLFAVATDDLITFIFAILGSPEKLNSTGMLYCGVCTACALLSALRLSLSRRKGRVPLVALIWPTTFDKDNADADGWTTEQGFVYDIFAPEVASPRVALLRAMIVMLQNVGHAALEARKKSSQFYVSWWPSRRMISQGQDKKAIVGKAAASTTTKGSWTDALKTVNAAVWVLVLVGCCSVAVCHWLGLVRLPPLFFLLFMGLAACCLYAIYSLDEVQETIGQEGRTRFSHCWEAWACKDRCFDLDKECEEDRFPKVVNVYGPDPNGYEHLLQWWSVQHSSPETTRYHLIQRNCSDMVRLALIEGCKVRGWFGWKLFAYCTGVMPYCVIDIWQWAPITVPSGVGAFAARMNSPFIPMCRAGFMACVLRLLTWPVYRGELPLLGAAFGSSTFTGTLFHYGMFSFAYLFFGLHHCKKFVDGDIQCESHGFDPDTEYPKRRWRECGCKKGAKKTCGRW